MRPFTRLASVIFAVICLAHILRIVLDMNITIGLFMIPKTASYVAIVVAAILSWKLWKESIRKKY